MNDTPYAHLDAFLNDWTTGAHDCVSTDIIDAFIPDLHALRDQLRTAVMPHPFGAWLDGQMRELDLGAGDIAEQSNRLLSASDIMNWRSGRTAPNANQAFILANAMGASVVETLGAAGHGHMVCAITDEWNEQRRASEPAVGSY